MDEQKSNEAIQRDEAWLADLCKRTQSLDTDLIKQRIRVEINEQWLARKLTDADSPSRPGQRIRAKVREAIADVSRENKHDSRPMIYRVYWVAAGTLTIAAMLLLTVGEILRPPAPRDMASDQTEPSYVEAFEQYQGDAWDTSLDELADDLDAFASASEFEPGSIDWDGDTSDGWFSPDEKGTTTDG